MKSKLLTLCLVLGMFAMGTPVKAEEHREEGRREELRSEGAMALPSGITDFLKLICNSALKNPNSTACTTFCENVGNPDWTQLRCCLASAASYDALPATLKSQLPNICGGAIWGCGPTKCSVPFVGATLENACGNICCSTKTDTTDLQACLQKQNQTCANFNTPMCPVATGCCPTKENPACKKDGTCCPSGQVFNWKTGECQPGTEAIPGVHPFM